MDNILDDTIQPETPVLTDKDVFTKIWTSPRQVFRFIYETGYDKYVWVLLVLSGIARAFDRAAMSHFGDRMSLGGVLFCCIVFGRLFGWIATYIYSGLVKWTGKWIGGQCDSTWSIVKIFAYSSLPTIASIIFIFPEISIYGNEIFKKDGDMTSADIGGNIVFYLSALLEVVMGVWTIVLGLVGISVAQQFSVGKALLNILLPILVILLPILVLIYFVLI